jgi:hypothetical protein
VRRVLFHLIAGACLLLPNDPAWSQDRHFGVETSPAIGLLDRFMPRDNSSPSLWKTAVQFGPLPAKTLASELAQPFDSHYETVDVPEPLLFDLVRPLGARKGELEFNTLAVFPWSHTNRDPEDDPFGSGPTTFDRGGIEWAPEVEYAPIDNFAIEFEFPFEGAKLEEYKLGLQWTIGTAFDNHYIHGFQVLVEPNTEWKRWNSTLLYLGGIRFDDTWSSLIMLGGRMDLSGPDNAATFERLVNASLFADLTDTAKVGLEANFAGGVDGTMEFILVPQIHYDFTRQLQVQAGLGFGAFSEGSEQSFIVRGIYCP